MSIKNLLVVIGEDSDVDAVLGPALSLAETHGAHIVALALTGLPDIDYGYGFGGYGGVITGEFIAESMDEARARVDKTAERLRAGLASANVGWEVRTAARGFSALAAEVAHHGRYADLILMMRAGEDAVDQQERLLDGAIFDSGRAVTLLPADWSGGFDERIVVAWDGSREAARAVGAAMPLIERAAEVRIALVSPRVGETEHGQEPGADLGAALSRHNQNVSVDRLPALDRTVGQALLDHASDCGADLLVLGAYGHSRLTEAVFGGVTHELIRSATLPLLMAH